MYCDLLTDLMEAGCVHLGKFAKFSRKNLRKIRTFLFVFKHKYITTRYNNDL